MGGASLLSCFGDVSEHSVTSEECEHTNTSQALESGEHVLQRAKTKNHSGTFSLKHARHPLITGHFSRPQNLFMKKRTQLAIQWNLLIKDTFGTSCIVLCRELEVVLFQR